MSKSITKCIAILALAGILMTPACSPIDGNKSLGSSKNEIVASPSPDQQSGEPQNTPDNSQNPGDKPADNSTDKPQEGKDSIQVITSDKELDEYFDSISDEDIQKLYDAIEGIDISGDINTDANPGFDQVQIP